MNLLSLNLDVVVVLKGSMGTVDNFLGLCHMLTWEVRSEPSSLIPSVAGCCPGRNGRCGLVKNPSPHSHWGETARVQPVQLFNKSG